MEKIIFTLLAALLLMPNSIVFAQAQGPLPHIIFTDRLGPKMWPMKKKSQTVLSFGMTLANSERDANAHALFVQCVPGGKIRKSDLKRELILKDAAGKVIAKAPKGKPCDQENGRQFVFINQPITNVF